MTTNFQTLDLITGRDLKRLFENKVYLDDVFLEKVIYDPSQALTKIKKFYGKAPSIDGANIHTIIEIRDILFHLAESRETLNAFTITAPHTHWPAKEPVIYTYANNGYVIGNHPIIEQNTYTPVSFVFHQNGPLAYEWTDSSVDIRKEEWEYCIKMLKELNDKLSFKNIPLGIAIDFRFRKSLRAQPEPSLEVPMDSSNPKFKDFSFIINQFGIAKNNSEEITEQVSWHAVSDLAFDFTPDELQIIHKLRTELSSIQSPEEQENVIKELTNFLGKNNF